MLGGFRLPTAELETLDEDSSALALSGFNGVDRFGVIFVGGSPLDLDVGDRLARALAGMTQTHAFICALDEHGSGRTAAFRSPPDGMSFHLKAVSLSGRALRVTQSTDDVTIEMP